jgi:PAS domain S-box-containing protein
MAKGDESFATGAEAARQAMTGVDEGRPLSAVLVFASVCYDLEEMLRGIHSVVGQAPVLGATTAGEICDGPQQGSVVVTVLASPYLRVQAGVGEGVSRDWRGALAQALSAPEVQPFFSPEENTIWPELTRQGKSAFALLFSPGQTQRADSLSPEILEELQRLSQGMLPIFGGSSADDWRLQTNYVLWNGCAYPDSLLVAVFETRLRFGTALAHGFRPSRRQATVTRAQGYDVLELDGEPAADVYARLIGVPRAELEGKHLTLATDQPVGTPDLYGQYNINVACTFTPQGGVRFALPVAEGTILTIIEADRDSMVAAGQDALRKALIRGHVGDPALAIVFSCALRTRILKDRTGEEIARMRDMLPGVPLVGFYSFGEQGLADGGANCHNNEVITILVLGRELSFAAQVALENEQLRQDIWEAKERYRTLVESISEVIYSVDRQGDVTYVSPSIERLIHYKADDIVGQPLTRFVHPDDLPGLLVALEDAMVGNLGPYEFRLLDKDGVVHYVHSSSGALVKDDQGVNLTGTLRDITARVQAEEALKETERHYRDLFEGAPVMYIVVHDREGTPIMADCNQSFLSVLGYSRAEVIGRPLGDFYTPASRHELLEGGGYRRALSNRFTTEERQLLARDGHIVHTLMHAAPETDATGRLVGTRAIYMDITERIQVEAALRESERNFSTFFNTIDELLFVLDGQGNIILANETVYRRLGYTEAELADQSVLMVHPPERRAEAAQIVQAMFLGQADYCPVPVITKDGRRIPVETRVVKGRWSGQEVIFGVTKDLSSLKASEEKFATAFQASPTLMAISELDSGRYIEVNDAFLRTMGYRRDEVIGRTSMDLDLFARPEQREVAMKLLEGQGHVRDFEALVRTKSGAVRNGLFAAEYIHLQDRPVLLTVMSDITERVQAAEEIRRRSAQLEALREVGLELTAQLDLATLLRSISARAVELVGGSGGGVYLYRPDQDGLEWTMSVGFNTALLGTILRRGEGVSGKVWETGQPLIVDDYQHWEGRAATYDGYPFTAVMAVPIRWGQDFLGVLNVNAGPPHIFSPADADLLSLFATQAAIAIRNARLYEQTRQDAETRAALLREVNHRVKNNLTAIIGLLYAEQGRDEAREHPLYQSIMRELINRVQGLAAVHSMLSASEWTPLHLSDLAMEIIRAALKTVPRDKEVCVNVVASPIRVTADQAHSLALVFNELATNTIRHAMVGDDVRAITVEIALDGDSIVCEYRDDGPGFSEAVLRGESHNVGLNLVHNVVRRSLHGDLTLRNDGGGVALIRFKAGVR